MMATKSTLVPLFFLLILLATATALGGGKLGGRTQVKNVKSNKEVQDLGKYCIQQYNRRLLKQGPNNSKLLIFSQVTKAETQIVSGTKYYLTLSASTRAGVAKTYSAVVVVKKWLNSTQLVSFAPATTPAFH